MRKMSTLLVWAALVVFVAACAATDSAEEPTIATEPTDKPALAPQPSEDPTAIPEPTEAPTEEPTEAPASEEEASLSEVDSDIVDVTWFWRFYQEQSREDDITVSNPENFTLTLMPDGTASIKADCNMVSWTYSLEGNSLTFNTLGPSTLAFCGEESLDQQFLALLGTTAAYVTDDGYLILNLADETGEMIFSPSSEIGEATGDVQPEEAEIEFVDKTWLWRGFQDTAGEANIAVPDPENFTLTLLPDGTASIKADCNMVSWTYTLEGNSLTFDTLGPSTLAFCGEESLDQQFLALMGSTATVVAEEGQLYLNLMADAGNMIFAEPTLTSAVWQWENMVTPLESYDVTTPELYTIRFNEDGTVNVKADCNVSSGTYTADDSGFAIELGPTTLAECGPESLSNDFIRDLGAAAIPFFEDGKLYMDLFADSGTMRFGAAAGAIVTGNVTYLQRIALPEDAIITIQIQDTSRADAAAEIIGQQVIHANGRQVPFPYAVTYNPEVIVENHTYTMSARITDGQGELLFINDTAIPVITNNNPASDVEIIVVQVG